MPMPSRKLHSVFASAVVVALASSTAVVAGVASVACGGSTSLDVDLDGGDAQVRPTFPDGAPVPDGAILPDGAIVSFDDAICQGTALFAGLADIRPAKPFDYLEVREHEVGGSARFKILFTSGEACRNAPDAEACKAELAAVRGTSDLFGQPIVGKQIAMARFVVVQTGAEVKRIGTFDELLAFFGTIDRPSEARLLVSASGYDVLCGAASVREVADGYEVVAKKSPECLNQFFGYVLHVSPSGAITEKAKVDLRDLSKGCAIAGRRPEGYRPPEPTSGSALSAYLGTMRSLEAASVPAFLRLAAELGHLGAPPDLVARAEEAARDEVRHAAGFSWLQSLYGASSEHPRAIEAPMHLRSPEEVALDNAVEGCVRETFGALCAGYQAEAAGDGAVRRLFATIAEDETRHAELSWDVAEWLEARLDVAARDRVRAARSRAIEDLAEAIRGSEPHLDLAIRCGLPSSAQATLLFRTCEAELWAA